MALHLVKLCVGCDSISDLEDWIIEKRRRTRGKKTEHIHITRMVPTRSAELIDGGSLYWVIRGQIACRQRLIDIRPFVDKEGIHRCQLVLEPKVTPVLPRPRAAFQGWRYLAPREAPADLGKKGKGLVDLPEELCRELGELGLL